FGRDGHGQPRAHRARTWYGRSEEDDRRAAEIEPSRGEVLPGAAKRRRRRRHDRGIKGMSGAIVLILALLAADWPRFRGSNGSGVADASEAPVEFANAVWKLPLPPGHSSPILSGTQVFLTALDGGKLYTYAIDRASGKIVWRRECPRSRTEPIDKRNSAASPSPVLDEANVYVFFGDYGLISYTHDGRERWRTPLGPFQNVYGMGASPILAGDKLILVCD